MHVSNPVCQSYLPSEMDCRQPLVSVTTMDPGDTLLTTKVKIEIDVAEDIPQVSASSDIQHQGLTHWNGSSTGCHHLLSETVTKTEPDSALRAEMETEVQPTEDRLSDRHRDLQMRPFRTAHVTSDFSEQESGNCSTETVGFEINFKTESTSESDIEAKSGAVTGQDVVISGVAISDSDGHYSESLERERGTHEYHFLVQAHSIKSETVLCTKTNSGTESNESTDFLQEVTQRREHKGSRNRPFSCSECPSTFLFHSHLERHMLSHDHNACRPFLCKTCKACFKLQCHLKQHSLIHSGERPFSCQECKATFTRSDHLKQHAKTHAGLRPYLCTVCNRTFTQVAHLRKHMIRHRDDRVVWCKIKTCKAMFTSVSELEKHRKTHAEDRRCKECSVILSRADDMKKHMRIHTKDKPYSCSICSARFSQAGHLSTHRLQHTGEKPFSCNLCGCGFKQSHHLKRHMEVHSGDRPFSCKVCNASFKRSSSLTRHKQKCCRPTLSTHIK